MLAADGAEGPHQRHVADHVGQFALDPRRPAGETVMQGRAGRGQPEQKQHDQRGNPREGRRQRDADDGEKGDGAHRRHAGRQYIPDEEIFDGEGCVGRRGDAAGQSSRQALREIARRMAGEMAKKFAPQIACHADEGMACDPAGQTPQQIVGGDQGHQHREGKPDRRAVRSSRQSVDEKLDAILRTYRAADGADDRCQNRRMCNFPPAHVAQQEGNRPFGVITEAIHPLAPTH